MEYLFSLLDDIELLTGQYCPIYVLTVKIIPTLSLPLRQPVACVDVRLYAIMNNVQLVCHVCYRTNFLSIF